MSNSPLKDLLAAMGVIKNADPKLVAALADDAAVEKALDGNRTSEKLKDGEMVSDHWAAGQTDKSATKEEVKVGPTQESSGAGAEKMIRDYSNPARQMHGVASVPEKLDAMLGSLGAVGKALDVLAQVQKATFEALGKNNTLLVTMISETAKAKAVVKGEDEEEEDDEEEESEVVEINEGKAKKSLRKAKALIKAADAKKAEMEDEDDEAKCKALKSEIAKLRKQAAKLLAKARDAAYAASSDELKKSIRLVATKADINVVQEEEEEDEEEEEGEGKAKKAAEKAAADAAAAAEKAKTDDKGHQADTLDTANGNQSAAAKAAKALEEKSAEIEKALKGIGMLQTDIRGLMDVVAGKSKAVDMTVVKSTNVDTTSLADRISQAEDSGQITVIDGMAARDIASKLEMVKAGKIDASFVNDRLSKTSSSVRALFSDLKVA